ncbi:hypothetical protein GA0115261_114821, partial [Streptomyces sp. OspMP-M43]
MLELNKSGTDDRPGPGRLPAQDPGPDAAPATRPAGD